MTYFGSFTLVIHFGSVGVSNKQTEGMAFHSLGWVDETIITGCFHGMVKGYLLDRRLLWYRVVTYGHRYQFCMTPCRWRDNKTWQS
jgi:hypothetical protein